MPEEATSRTGFGFSCGNEARCLVLSSAALTISYIVVCDDNALDAVVSGPVRQDRADIPRVVDHEFLLYRHKGFKDSLGVGYQARGRGPPVTCR